MSATQHGVLAVPALAESGAEAASHSAARAAVIALRSSTSGALRRLNELGVLSRVDTFTSVSGGSIFAALIAAYACLDPGVVAAGTPVRGFDDGRGRADAGARRSTTSARHGPGPRSCRELARSARRRSMRSPSALRQGPAPGTARRPARAAALRLLLAARCVPRQWAFDSGLRRVGSRAERASAGSATGRSLGGRRVLLRPRRVRGRPEEEPSTLTGGTYDGDDATARPRDRRSPTAGCSTTSGWSRSGATTSPCSSPTRRPPSSPSPDVGVALGLPPPGVILLEQATEVRKRWLVANFIEERCTARTGESPRGRRATSSTRRRMPTPIR